MYRLLLFAFIISSCTAQDDPPFCRICACSNDASNYFDVTCTKDVSSILFDVNKWIDKDNNQTYFYKSIKVHNNPIVMLDKPFPNSSLVLLDLANNSIFNISNNIFSNLQNMETLILSYNNIEVLDPKVFDGQYLEGDFRPLKSLKKLHLDHNRIHSLHQDIFEHTSRVEVLTLSHNPLAIIDHHTTIAITSLVYLKELDLSYTQLSTLPDYFLHTPKFLTFLDLSGNNLEGIPSTLGDSQKLTVLYINDNPIVNLTEKNGFPLIPTLKALHMKNMPKLVNISKNALSNLTGLEELYIYENMELCHIDKAALSSRKNGAEYETWPPIRKLYLQDNKLTSIDMQLILNWKSLSELDLTNNPWTCECENQWMVDELIPIYLDIDEKKAHALKCAAPIEMESLTFYDIYMKHSTMRCLDLYGHRPEGDGKLLVGVLAGVLMTIPVVLFIIYSYQRHWFGVFDSSPASFSRQFYKRTVSNDEYF